MNPRRLLPRNMRLLSYAESATPKIFPSITIYPQNVNSLLFQTARIGIRSAQTRHLEFNFSSKDLARRGPVMSAYKLPQNHGRSQDT